MEVELIRVSEKGQVVIPSTLRRELRIETSDQFLVFGEGGTIILKKIEKPLMRKTFEELAAPLRKAARQIGLSRQEF